METGARGANERVEPGKEREGLLVASSPYLGKRAPVARKERELYFQGYRLEYYSDGSGKIFEKDGEEPVYETADASYRGESLYDAVFLDAKKGNVIDVIKTIGFPRFPGDDADSLDFGRRDEGIVRVDFKDRVFARMYTVAIDGEMEKAWVMPNRADFVTPDQCAAVKSGMTVDDAVEILGKAHALKEVDDWPNLEWRIGESRSLSLKIAQNPSDATDHRMYVFHRFQTTY